MHLAAAVGTPVVALFGSTSPELTGPGYSTNVQIVRRPVPCAPCFRRECPIDLRCLKGIEIAQVVESARRLLNR
jgi:heptosyltransferase-2